MKPSDYPFDSFNARALSPKQVAGGFVPPDSFTKLSKRRHSVIAGPRGSGKTTLLKMLQTSALRFWNHPEANEIRAQIDFTGVFIPTDRTWSEQLCAVGGGQISDQQRDVLGVSAFTTQILRATLVAMMERVAPDEDSIAPEFRRVLLSPSKELSFASSLMRLWGVDAEAPTLTGLRLGLTQRLMQIHKIANQCVLLSETERNNLLSSTDFLHLNFLSAIPAFLDLFEDITGLHDERWALLFDELELAPKAIRESLSQALRSVDQRIIFKLSIAPFSRELEDSVKAASDKNDFELIRLWYPSKEDGYPFSRSLIQQMLFRRGLEGTPEDIFGQTLGEHDSNTRSREYRHAPEFRSLAMKDPSFKSYLAKAGVALSDISQPSENQQAATLRKIISIVTVRNTYLRRQHSATDRPNQQRSRKAMHIYCGIPAILAICEGNPRWLIGLTDALLENINQSGVVPLHVQDRELSGLLSRFFAYLRTIPSHPSQQSRAGTNIHFLIDSIGKAMTHEVLEKPFNPDPVGTFLVDSHATDDQLQALEQATYSGALVFVPESENEIATGSLRGKRFRLTYLLAPKYKLPLVLLRAKSLSALLSGPSAKQDELFK